MTTRRKAAKTVSGKKEWGQNTACVHAGGFHDEQAGGINTPIFTSTSYRYSGGRGPVLYPRYYNTPTQRAVADKIAALEKGEACIVLSSGMSAISSVILSFLKQGDHAVFQSDVYGGTHNFIVSELGSFGIETAFVYNTHKSAFEKAIKKNTRLIYIETPSNPLLKIVDIEAIAKLARSRGIVTVIDNTFATPINQRPLSLGIDVVVHSGTKYLNGHSDVNCGAIVTSMALMRRIYNTAVNHGGTLDAHACYMLERGLKTLGLRMQKQNENAMEIASFLNGHKKVRTVYYPGLNRHAEHKVAEKQMSGFGGIVSFELNCSKGEARKRVKNLRLITQAVSLGGVESLICFPSETSHAKMSSADRKKAGISDTLLRLSVGIEDSNDLIQDIETALLKKH